MSNNYLLLKVSAIEHVSPSDPCRIVEDILTIVCNQSIAQVSPTPTLTPTPTPTPAPSFDTIISLAGSSSIVTSYSSEGLTFTSVGGSFIRFNKQPISSTIGVSYIRKGTPQSSVEIATIVFGDSYLNTQYKLTINDTVYMGVFTNNTTYFA